MRNPSLPDFAATLGSSPPPLPVTYSIEITSPEHASTQYMGARAVTVSVTPTVAAGTTVLVYDGVELVGTGTVGSGVTTEALALGPHSLTATVTIDGVTSTSEAVVITCVSPVITLVSQDGLPFAPRVHLYAGQENATVLWTLGDGETSTELAPTSWYGTEHTLTVDPPTAIECLNFGYDGGDGGDAFVPVATYAHANSTLVTAENLRYGAPNARFVLGNRTAYLDALDLSNLPLLESAEFYLSEITAANYAGCVSLLRVCHEETRVSLIDLRDAVAFRDLRARGQDIGDDPLVIRFPADMSSAEHLCAGTQPGGVTGFEAINSGAVELPVLSEYWMWGALMTGTFSPHCSMASLLAADNMFSGFDSTRITWEPATVCDLSRNPLTSLVLAGDSTLNTRILFDFTDCGMSQALVDYAIQALAAGSAINGALNLTGNAAPSAARADDIAILRGRGCTVTVET